MSRRGRPGYDPTLADTTAHQVAGIRCWCLACDHTALLPLAPLIERLGPGFLYLELGARLRCTACGALGAQTQLDWPPAPREIDRA